MDIRSLYNSDESDRSLGSEVSNSNLEQASSGSSDVDLKTCSDMTLNKTNSLFSVNGLQSSTSFSEEPEPTQEGVLLTKAAVVRYRNEKIRENKEDITDQGSPRPLCRKTVNLTSAFVRTSLGGHSKDESSKTVKKSMSSRSLPSLAETKHVKSFRSFQLPSQLTTIKEDEGDENDDMPIRVLKKVSDPFGLHNYFRRDEVKKDSLLDNVYAKEKITVSEAKKMLQM